MWGLALVRVGLYERYAGSMAGVGCRVRPRVQGWSDGVRVRVRVRVVGVSTLGLVPTPTSLPITITLALIGG